MDAFKELACQPRYPHGCYDVVSNLRELLRYMAIVSDSE